MAKAVNPWVTRKIVENSFKTQCFGMLLLRLLYVIFSQKLLGCLWTQKRQLDTFRTSSGTFEYILCLVTLFDKMKIEKSVQTRFIPNRVAADMREMGNLIFGDFLRLS